MISLSLLMGLFMTLNSRLEIALTAATSCINTPYVFGGRSCAEGLDCSQLSMLYLRALGTFSTEEDYSAAEIYNKLMDKVVTNPYRGCLVFYKSSKGNIEHVEIMLSEEQSIGASGGDSTTTDIKTAIAKDAYVKIHSIKFDSRTKVFVDPLF